MGVIRTWLSLSQSEKKKLEAELRTIFFVSSARQNFSDDAAKENFWRRWTDYYFLNCPDLIFLYFVKDQLAGYLMGCANSLKAEAELRIDLPSYSLFSDLFSAYPGHLHINLHPDYRGQGLGSLLITALCTELSKRKCSGVHLITSPEARNASFYRQNGFDFEQTRSWRESALLFMGRTLK